MSYKKILRDIVDSIRGIQRDYTELPLGRAILLLSIPMILEMVMESIFAVVDIYFVSSMGESAITAVGITESLITIVYSIGVGLSAATTAMVARRIGEKKPELASRVTGQAIIAALVVSAVISAVGLLYSEKLLVLMGASKQAIAIGGNYAKVMITGNGVILLLFVINAVFRSSGDAARSMRVLWLANLLNIALDPCLIFGLGPFPALGVTGAAVATNIGRGVAVIYQFYLLFGGKGIVKVEWKSFIPDLSVMKRIFKLSVGGISQSIIVTSSWIMMMKIVNNFGDKVTAGYTIAIRVIIFSLLPSLGLSNAAATLVGQNLGAKKAERAERAVWIASMTNVAILGLIGLVFALVPEIFVKLINMDGASDPDLIRHGSTALRYISYGFIFYGIGMVMVQSFNGAGDTSTPTKINLFCFWALEIPLAFYLALHSTMDLDAKGVYLSIIIAEGVMAIIGVYLFKKGRWKTKTV